MQEVNLLTIELQKLKKFLSFFKNLVLSNLCQKKHQTSFINHYNHEKLIVSI